MEYKKYLIGVIRDGSISTHHEFQINSISPSHARSFVNDKNIKHFLDGYAITPHEVRIVSVREIIGETLTFKNLKDE